MFQSTVSPHFMNEHSFYPVNVVTAVLTMPACRTLLLLCIISQVVVVVDCRHADRFGGQVHLHNRLQDRLHEGARRQQPFHRLDTPDKSKYGLKTI